MGRRFDNPNSNSGNGGNLLEGSALWSATLALTNASAQTLAAAQATRAHILNGLQAINTGASVVDLILLDGNTEIWRLPLPPNVPLACEPSLRLSSGSELSARLQPSGTVRLNAQGFTT